MCIKYTVKTICSNCDKKLSETTDDIWCSAARKKGTFGRCPKGVMEQEGDARGQECEACAIKREADMERLDMDDFAENRLGWKGKKKADDERKGKGKGKEIARDDEEEEWSDDGGGYGW
ncbi:hypothetical protein F4810DRAFT_495089 [Camillea tinctor]|nr:hypothetical protein F4810DRAFT_495089 [Camillea tinctor]